MAIKYSILGLLLYKDMHGYRIKEHIEKNFGYMWSINYGQIYPNLKRLRADGLITQTEIVQNGEKGPPRKLYSITPAGEEAFFQWVSSPPEKPMILRDPFLMKFVFFGFGDQNRSLEIIDEQVLSTQEQLDRRKKNLEKWRSGGIYVRLISELGVNMNEMFLEWLKGARQEIADHFHEDDK
jgi:DNA-binding PadR family transcriptional regulator